MNIEFYSISSYMFKNYKYRINSYENFKPCFLRFIGADNEELYNNSIKELKNEIELHKEICLLFENTIPVNAEFELIQYIYDELDRMDVGNIKSQEIVLFQNQNINKLFLEALNYVVLLSIKKENFLNDNVRNNFITKLIVWTYSFIREIKFDDQNNPKCVYYGEISRHEVYFLILLYLMGFDVVYINSLKEEYFNEIDEDNLSQCKKSMSILPLESFEKRALKGKDNTVIESTTKKIQKDVQDMLFEGTGVYKPWQFRMGYTKSILLDAILEDIYSYWNEPSKLREGFRVDGQLVTVPCFFYKIDGQFLDMLEYKKLVQYCIESPNTLFFNSGDISNEYLLTDNVYELMFCQLSDGSFDIEEVKETSIYKFGKYSKEVQNFMLKKVNEIILNNQLFNINLEKETTLKLLVLVLSLNEKIVRLIDNFDFTGDIPKIVIYLNEEEEISESMTMLLGYIHIIGIDIVIFNPSGLFNINHIIKEGKIINIRLQKMSYDSTYKSILGFKQSIFSRILKNI